MITKACWWVIPDAVVDDLKLDAVHLAGAAHGAEHTAIGLLPMFSPCDRSFLALAVMVVRPFSDVPDDEATAALLDKLAGLVSATQGRIIRHQVERTHPLSS